MKVSGKLILILSVTCVILALTGCSNKDSDRDYNGEMDAEYLMSEYPEQLLRDGADTVTGTVTITGTEGDYTVNVDEKKVVSNENYEDGYYIADKNMNSSYPLGSDHGILAKNGDETVACTTEEFIENSSDDSETLYTVYLIGDVVELIQPLDPKAAAEADN